MTFSPGQLAIARISSGESEHELRIKILLESVAMRRFFCVQPEDGGPALIVHEQKLRPVEVENTTKNDHYNEKSSQNVSPLGPMQRKSLSA